MPSTQLETGNPKLETDLREIAQDIVRRAMSGGATAAECVVREGDEFSTLVRLGQVETLKESGSRSIGVRVFNGERAASTYSSDFSRASLDRMLNSALELSKITSEDPFGGIPDASQLGSLTGDLDLYHEDVYSLPGPDRIDYARRTEKAALDFDPRIKNSEGGSFDAATGHKVLANSHGFVGEYRRSYCSVSAVPIAQTDDGAMQLQGVAPEGLVAERVETEDMAALSQEIVDHARAQVTGLHGAGDLIFDLVTGAPDAASDGAVVFRIAFELVPVEANDVVRRTSRGSAQTGGAGDRRRDQQAGRDDRGTRKEPLR